MLLKIFMTICVFAVCGHAQVPPIEPGVSRELAKWRAERYSDVRYKLNLTLEKMSPVLKGTIEIRVKVAAVGESIPPAVAGGAGSEPPASAGGMNSSQNPTPIILDWRKIRGSESLSTISNVSINGISLRAFPDRTIGSVPQVGPPKLVLTVQTSPTYEDLFNDHLIFRDGVVIGENVIKLDFTSPILTSGSAITRYVDKEDGAEYIYSLFVPSDASTAFPVFDQPDLKARFSTYFIFPADWAVVSNGIRELASVPIDPVEIPKTTDSFFSETKPISTYVFAFAAGPFERVSEPPASAGGTNAVAKSTSGPTTQRPSNAASTPPAYAGGSDSIYVRKSQAAKFKPHAAELFRLNREAIKYFETYFDYKFPFPKYDLVLIPEFPFGGMEHAGATFLRESSIIFPQEPTKNDYISRATLIFHEAAHQWFGDTVTMRWFDDLWLKEGFATFTAYKAMEKIMPEYNAWKVFYERVKQAAYQTDSTKGTTPIYQEIKNLSAAKSAYGAIVYNKAPAFLRQAEFYLGEDKFQTAVRAFLKKHEFGNAGWEDLVSEFERASGEQLSEWADGWVKRRGLAKFRVVIQDPTGGLHFNVEQSSPLGEFGASNQKFRIRLIETNGEKTLDAHSSLQAKKASLYMYSRGRLFSTHGNVIQPITHVIFPNFSDYGYGIFLLDPKSRDYVLKNIQNEKDDFLRSMMWGALWDSVREGEMDPREYVELVVKELATTPAAKPATPPSQGGEQDESTIQTLLSRVSTAMRYYIHGGGSSAGSVPPTVAGGALKPGQKSTARGAKTPPATAGGTDRASDLQARVEALLIDRMQNAPTPGQKITYYRAFLSIGSSANARRIMKEILKQSSARGSVPPAVAGGALAPGKKSVDQPQRTPPATAGGTDPMRPNASTTKDRFDIVTRLIILGDPDAAKLLADLERSETSDDAKRYAYAARAGFPTAENKAKFWNDFVAGKDISESWIEAALGPFNNIRHSDLTLPYLRRALEELPNHKRNRKIFFVNGWLGAFIGGQNSDAALAIINKFLADNPNLDNDLRLKILENADIIERAVKIRGKY